MTDTTKGQVGKRVIGWVFAAWSACSAVQHTMRIQDWHTVWLVMIVIGNTLTVAALVSALLKPRTMSWPFVFMPTIPWRETKNAN